MSQSSTGYRYYLAAGRSLEAIALHRRAIKDAVEEVQAFVMLCGAERALGSARITGLHFNGPLPAGWVRNAAAPHMAVPDTTTVRGASLDRKMALLRIPADAEFAALIGIRPQMSSDDDLAPLVAALWPSYERVQNGWIVKCPPAPRSKIAPVPPPDCIAITPEQYKAMKLVPTFNLAACEADE